MLVKLLLLVAFLILGLETGGNGNLSVLALLFCNETDSSPDLRLEFDSGLLKYRDRGRINANLFILNQTASLRSGLSFNVTCASRRAVDWKFDGLTANSAVKIDRYRNHDTTCHRMSLNFTTIDDQLTGTYTCYEISRPWKSLNFTLFTGRLRDGHFFRLHGQTFDIRSDPGADLDAEVISFPCGLVNPFAQVRLLARIVPGGEWNTVAISSNRSSEFAFSPIHGFKVNVNRLHNGEYKCTAFENEEDGQSGQSQRIHNFSDVVSFNYRRLEGPTFIPQADTLVLPRNLTSYQIQCSAPYPVHVTVNGSLAFDVSNDPSESSTRFKVIAKYRPGSLINSSTPEIASQNHSTLYMPSTRVLCMRNVDETTKNLLKAWNVRISSDEFLPGIHFDKTAGTATCYSSTVEVLQVSQVFCETDTEYKLREPCITEKENWKCPAPHGNPKGPNIVLRNETAITIDLQYRSGVLRCKSSDMDAMIVFHNSVNGELRLDDDRENAFGLEIFGNHTVETFGNVTAQCTASKRLFYSKVNLELWNKGSLAAYVLPDMILKDEFSELAGLFVRKMTFQVPRGEYDELTCFVETYSPRAGYVIRRPLVVYQHTSPPYILGPSFVPVSLKKGAYNNLTCEGQNWSNISWEIPPTIKLSDLTISTKGTFVSELIIPVLDPKYEGLYACLVENNFGVARKAFMVQVPEVEGSIPWFAIAIAAGVVIAFGVVAFIWWTVRKLVVAAHNLARSRTQPHPHRLEYPLELTIKTPPPEAEPQHGDETRDEKVLQNILQQFHEGIWPLSTTAATVDESDAVVGQNEDSFSSSSPSITYTHTETGNHVAMSVSYNFEEHEIPRDNVQLYSNRVLGSGEFGIVHGGKLHGRKYSQPIPIAIKTLPADADGDCVSAFLKELQIMIYVGKHPNIVELLGACTQAKSIDHIYIILRLCPNGSLEKYLRTRRKMFVNQITEDGVIDRTISPSPPKTEENSTRANFISTQDLLRWTIQIAAGMQFLVEKKVIHGDLACRNVLLDENLVVKISDFGLARRLYDYTKYVKKKQALLPWRWMAIESLQDLHFSPASDVWAFGVTAWEIFSLSEIPYPGIVWSMQFVEQLRAGHRNVKPRYATEEMFAILKDCWLQDPTDRPTMAQVLDQLSAIFTRDFISSNASSEYIDL